MASRFWGPSRLNTAAQPAGVGRYVPLIVITYGKSENLEFRDPSLSWPRRTVDNSADEN